MIKEKNALDLPPQRRFSRPVKTLLGTAVLLCACLLIVVIYRSVGFIPSNPDAALLPTAEYLYEHPQPIVAAIQFNPQTSAMQRKICYWSDAREEDLKTSSDLSDFPSSLLFINGSRVPPNDIHVEINLIEPESINLASCVNVAGLNAGLHLVELHLKVNPWDTPLIYQWAVMIEE